MQSRNQRRKDVHVVLTKRDEDLLTALARFRIARTSDLLQLAFPGVRRDTALERLRRLFDGAYLEVQSENRMSENVYALGRNGRRWATDRGLPTGKPPKSQAHHLTIVRTWIELREHHQLIQTRPDWELRHQLRGAKAVPDLHVETIDGAFLIEVDMGTESVPTLKAKLAAYQHDFLAGLWETETVVIAARRPTEARRRAIQRLIDGVAYYSAVLVTLPLRAPITVRGVPDVQVVVAEENTDSPSTEYPRG